VIVRRSVLWLIPVAVALADFATADDHGLRSLVAEEKRALDLLSNAPIHVDAAGHAEAEFGRLLEVLEQETVLTDVQKEYARMLPPGEKPEFVIQETSPRHYSYVNKKKQTSELWELCRKLDDAGVFHIVYFAQGERFFGSFKALIHVRACRNHSDNVNWFLSVYAFPENRVYRFLARNIGVVRSYFRSKTRDVGQLGVSICQSLCKKQEPRD